MSINRLRDHVVIIRLKSVYVSKICCFMLKDAVLQYRTLYCCVKLDLRSCCSHFTVLPNPGVKGRQFVFSSFTSTHPFLPQVFRVKRTPGIHFLIGISSHAPLTMWNYLIPGALWSLYDMTDTCPPPPEEGRASALACRRVTEDRIVARGGKLMRIVAVRGAGRGPDDVFSAPLN